jgi:hypothetical protein
MNKTKQLALVRQVLLKMAKALQFDREQRHPDNKDRRLLDVTTQWMLWSYEEKLRLLLMAISEDSSDQSSAKQPAGKDDSR